jgi:hypothetical protein
MDDDACRATELLSTLQYCVAHKGKSINVRFCCRLITLAEVMVIARGFAFAQSMDRIELLRDG